MSTRNHTPAFARMRDAHARATPGASRANPSTHRIEIEPTHEKQLRALDMQLDALAKQRARAQLDVFGELADAPDLMPQVRASLHALSERARALCAATDPSPTQQHVKRTAGRALAAALQPRARRARDLQQTNRAVAERDAADTTDDDNRPMLLFMRADEEAAAERERDIAAIVRGVTELNELMHDLATLVTHQGQMIDVIENNIGAARDHVASGVVQIDEAEVHQKRAHHKTCILILIVVIIALAFVLSF